MTKATDYIYILITIVFTVYGQLIIKLRLSKQGALPTEMLPKLKFLMLQLFDPGIFSGFVAAFIASLAWMAAMTKFELSFAYPFMALNFALVLILSVWLFSEPLTTPKVLGVVLIIIGTVVVSKG